MALRQETGPVPASFHGPGWRERVGTHAEDVAAGAIWRRCGVRSESAPLRTVLLARPPEAAFAAVDADGQARDPDAVLFLAWPDRAAMVHQNMSIAAFYRSMGVEVLWVEAPAGPPNLVFQRDLFFMMPEGAVMARPGAAPRAGEVRLAAAALAEAGVPILGMPRGDAQFEGADALWLDAETVLIGVGHRTNQAGACWLTAVLGDFAVKTHTISLPPGVQHLLGIVNFVAPDLAIVRGHKAPQPLLSVLAAHGVEAVSMPQGPEIDARFAMNFVTLCDRTIVMPAGCPDAANRFEEHGITVHTLDISAYQAAAGGLGCLTGIVLRG